eukprot:TRINITY_DN1096_c0_g1_i1.p1 TRINITY_DN1096_c0_g1~~TRINITY_DN1096_c0_g1_i1.p1  ORF type:complete len:449 (-),score=103.38 TRINITY_DN1096_c0_g1_i1:1351-2697(-)
MSSSESSSSSSSSKWAILGGIGALVAVGVGVGVYFSRKPSSPAPEKKTEEPITKQPTEDKPKESVPSPITTATVSAPSGMEVKEKTTEQKTTETKKKSGTSAAELVEQLNERVQILQQEQKVTARDHELLECIRKTDPSEFQDKERFQVVQSIILIHALQAIQVSSEIETKLAEGDAKKDWPVCWNLLDFSEEAKQAIAEEDKRVLEQFKLDVAIRLEDKSKILSVFDSIYKAGSLTEDELNILLTVAPNIGKWKAFQDIGRQLIALDEKALEKFHLISITRPEMVDYEHLYNITKDIEDADFKDICWKTYTQKCVRVRKTSIQCSDEQKKKQLEEESGEGFVEMPLPPEGNKIQVMGAFARTVSLTNLVPVPVTGPFSPSKFHLGGYIDIKGREMFIHQEDDYQLTKDTETGRLSVWKGVYSTKQSNASTRLQMTFECIMTLEEEDS